MKILRLLSLLIFVVAPALAQEKTVPQATDTEVQNGTDVHKYVNPRQYQQFMTGGSGGGSNSPTFLQTTQLVYNVGSNAFIAKLKGKGTNTTFYQQAVASQPMLSAVDQLGNTNFMVTDEGVFLPNTPASWPTDPSYLMFGSFQGGTPGQLGFLLDYRFTNSPVTGQGYISGDGEGFTNLANGNIVISGSNITITYSTNSTGKITATASVADPLSLNTGNWVNLTATNFFTATNDMTGQTVVDFSTGSFATMKLSGNLTLSGFQNAQSGVYNDKIIDIDPGGADRTVSVPASWKKGRFNLNVVTNGVSSLFWLHLQPGVRTNWYQLDAL